MPKKDLDLGHGVFIGWTSFEGKRIGGILIHPKTTELNNEGECFASFWFDRSAFGENDQRPIWGFNNDFEKPTLTPSFLCHCDFHGWIQEGKWVQA